MDTIEYYNKYASRIFEDTVDRDMEPQREEFLEELREIDGDTILDLGCGSGRDSLAFYEQGFDVTPLDASEEMCKLAEIHTGLEVLCMDYEDMEAKIQKNRIHLAVFCNPHNPCGRVWEKDEIEKAMEVYKRNSCVVISDEIWSDLMLNGSKHTPTQSVSEDARDRTIALYAPSKTFNLAGLIGSYHIIYNDYLRDRVLAQSSKCHYNEMNLMSMYALIGAYRPEGYEWVDELCEVLSENVNYAYDYIQDHFDGVEVSKPQGTYMLFLDCTKWCEKHEESLDELLRAGWDVGVAWQDGRPFHGSCSIRMNLASPKSQIEKAFERLSQYVF